MNNTQKLHSYPKVWSLAHREVAELIKEPCIVEEKIDGSQFSFGIRDAVQGSPIYFRSKGAVIDEGDPPDIFKAAVREVRRIHEFIGLHPGWTYRGEALKGKGHNSLRYDREPANHVVIWDIDQGEENLLGWDDKYIEAARLGYEISPILYEGIVTLDILTELLKRPPMLGGKMIEGVVIKRTRDNTIYGRDGKVLVGKYVSDGFKEVHASNPEYKKTSKKDIVSLIAAQYSTEARWNKVVQHLAEEGMLLNAPQDIPNILKGLQEDIREESLDEIKDTLLKYYWKDISKKLVKNVPRWYIDRLTRENVSG